MIRWASFLEDSLKEKREGTGEDGGYSGSDIYGREINEEEGVSDYYADLIKFWPGWWRVLEPKLPLKHFPIL